MSPNIISKGTVAPKASQVLIFVKLIGVLYLISRTVKIVYEIAEHIEKKKNRN